MGSTCIFVGHTRSFKISSQQNACITDIVPAAIMQLRLYAMYRQSRRILVLLLTLFFCEIFAIAFIIWRTIGPYSSLRGPSTLLFIRPPGAHGHPAMSNVVLGQHFCAFSGINGDFVYIFIPFLCFEFFLFLLAARMFIENVKRNRQADEEGAGIRMHPFMSILARDSLCYFFV